MASPKSMSEQRNVSPDDRWTALGVASDRAIPGRVLADSSGLGWNTVHVRTYAENSITEAFEPASTDTVLIVLVRRGHYLIESRRGTAWESAHYRPGSMGATLPGRVPVLRWRASSPELGKAMQYGGSSLYADSVAMGLAVHLVQASHLRPAPAGSSRGLGSAPLARVIDHMHAHLAERISLDELAAVTHLSKHHFVRQFKTATGLPPYAYLNRSRLEKGARLLRTDRTVDSVARACGFGSAGQFAKGFARAYGVSPSVYRRSMA